MTQEAEKKIEAMARAIRRGRFERNGTMIKAYDPTIPLTEGEIADARAALSALDGLSPREQAGGWVGDKEYWCAPSPPKEAAQDMVSGWQPIETAPKSTTTPTEHGHRVQGVYLLGYCPDEGVEPAQCITVIWWEPNENGGKGAWFIEGAFEGRPTHWRPLPEPPDLAASPSAVDVPREDRRHGIYEMPDGSKWHSGTGEITPKPKDSEDGERG